MPTDHLMILSQHGCLHNGLEVNGRIHMLHLIPYQWKVLCSKTPGYRERNVLIVAVDKIMKFGYSSEIVIILSTSDIF